MTSTRVHTLRLTAGIPVAILIVCGPTVPAGASEMAGDSSDASSFWTHAHGDAVELSSVVATGASGPQEGGGGGNEHLRWMRAPVCPRGSDSLGALTPCIGDPAVPLPECGDRADAPERPCDGIGLMRVVVFVALLHRSMPSEGSFLFDCTRF